MRVSSRGSLAAAVGVAVALVVTGCTSKSGDTGNTGGKSGGQVILSGGEPANPLIPALPAESNGIKVIDALFTGLVRYDPETAKPKNAAAESIDTKDAKVYTVKLHKGWKFHDGTEMKAKNFVDAWNWAAYTPNGAQNASFFADIAGYADVTSEDPDGDGPLKAPAPKTDKMSGLKIVDDYTFEITLSAPNSVFPVKIGYTAFSPLPDVFFKDTKAFGEKPIGNGPMKFESWAHNDKIVLDKYADYKGDDPVKVDKVTYKNYTTSEAAYADLQSNLLDGLEQVPSADLIGEKYKTDLGDGRWQEIQVGVETFVEYPIYDKRFKNPKLRQAISLAVDRKTITDKIFNKTREPATSFAPATIPGARADTCKYCEFNPAKAKQLLTEAGGWTGDLTFYYNGDASHKDWMEAMANSVAKSLGIKATAKPIPTFAQFRTQIDANKMTGPYRASWAMDYPSIEDWLNPLYRTKASSNDGLYSNPQVDALLKQADATADPAGATKLYQQAEDIVGEDIPVIPMWYSKAQAGFSDRVANARLTPFGEVDLTTITVK
jgi:oligopeptide transport system substrate-binding protein